MKCHSNPNLCIQFEEIWRFLEDDSSTHDIKLPFGSRVVYLALCNEKCHAWPFLARVHEANPSLRRVSKENTMFATETFSEEVQDKVKQLDRDTEIYRYLVIMTLRRKCIFIWCWMYRCFCYPKLIPKGGLSSVGFPSPGVAVADTWMSLVSSLPCQMTGEIRWEVTSSLFLIWRFLGRKDDRL